MWVRTDGAMRDYQAMMWWERLRYWREQGGWSQTELAQRADFHLSHLNGIECGHRPQATIVTLLVLAEALGVTPGVLLDSHPMPDRNRADRRGRQRSFRP